MKITIDCRGQTNQALSNPDFPAEYLAALVLAWIYDRTLYLKWERPDPEKGEESTSQLRYDRRDETVEKILKATREILKRES